MSQDAVNSPSLSPASKTAHTPQSVLELAGAELATSVFRTVNALLASPTDAEEVTLDTLVQLHKHLADLDEEGIAAWVSALPAWLDKAAVTRAKGRTKKRKRHADKLEELARMHGQLADEVPPKQATAKLVREILSYFPGRHRFAVVLHYGLGHGNAQTAELLAVEEATVVRTLDAVSAKLRQFATHAPIAGALVEGMGGASTNPLRDYMEHYGAPNEATQARIQRRFQSYLREGVDLVELTGEYSFHDGVFSDSSRRLEALIEAGAAADGASAEPTTSSSPEAASLDSAGPDRSVAWLVATVALVALALLGVAQYKLLQRLDTLDQNLAALQGQPGVTGVAEHAVVLEPGSFVRLEHGGQAEPSKDARAKLLRSDAKGAEFELEAGSISLHVKPAEGVEWVVHVGDYDVRALGTRFRVTWTEALPEVEVFEGKVEVSGGELDDAGVVVSSSTRTLAATMKAPLGAEPRTGETGGAAETGGAEQTGETGGTGETGETEEDVTGLASEQIYARAVALRETNEVEAETLLWVIVERGEVDEITERAFDQLRSLVPPELRVSLRDSYLERFPKGRHAEDFAAMGCRATAQDERADCWTVFRVAYPDSLYGP